MLTRSHAPEGHRDRGAGRPLQRYDRMQWRVDASKIRRPPELRGMVDAPGVATRTGVFIYPEPDGQVVRELRPRFSVMEPDSLATLVGVAITDEHPGDGDDDDGGEGEVTHENVRELAHGWVLGVEPDEPDEGLVGVWTRLASAEIQQTIDGGKLELSCGYTAILVDPHDPPAELAELIAALGPEPGVTHDGERYDFVQTRIRYNHLAVVGMARAGPVARLRLDGQAQTMKKIILDGKTHEIPEWFAASIQGQAVKASAKTDQMEVGEITIEGQTLTLPKAMIEQILAFLGAGSEPAAAAEPEVDVGAPDEDPARFDQDEEEDEPARTDAVPDIKEIVKAEVGRALRGHLPKAIRTVTDSVTAGARDRANLEREAQVVLGARFDYGSADDQAIACAVLKEAESPHLSRADQLADQARKGDRFADGQLRTLMDITLDEARARKDSSGDLGLQIFRVADQGGDAEKTLPAWEAARRSKVDSASGRVTQDDSAA